MRKLKLRYLPSFAEIVDILRIKKSLAPDAASSEGNGATGSAKAPTKKRKTGEVPEKLAKSAAIVEDSDSE